jgi:hypothetical protein
VTDVREIVEHAVERLTPPEPSFERLLRRRDRKRRNQRIASGVVGFALFLATIGLVVISPDYDRSSPGGGEIPDASAAAQPTAAPATEEIVGLPLAGAAPSAPVHGQLVLRLEGNMGASWSSLWIYADGRLVWGDVGGTFPSDAPVDGATGFVEQHLTPSWVESLRAQVVSTGLFTHDLALRLGFGDLPNFLTIQVRNDRLVTLTWAVSVNGIVPEDAPEATPAQASMLEGVFALLTDTTSWPERAWVDREVETFVPARYQVWLRDLPDQGEGGASTVGERQMALLPAAAVDLLREGRRVREATYELTTHDTRVLAEALIDAGLEPETMPMGEAVVRFSVDDPYEPGNSLILVFGPVLPHDEAVFLGPG